MPESHETVCDHDDCETCPFHLCTDSEEDGLDD